MNIKSNSPSYILRKVLKSEFINSILVFFPHRWSTMSIPIGLVPNEKLFTRFLRKNPRAQPTSRTFELLQMFKSGARWLIRSLKYSRDDSHEHLSQLGQLYSLFLWLDLSMDLISGCLTFFHQPIVLGNSLAN